MSATLSPTNTYSYVNHQVEVSTRTQTTCEYYYSGVDYCAGYNYKTVNVNTCENVLVATNDLQTYVSKGYKAGKCGQFSNLILMI